MEKLFKSKAIFLIIGILGILLGGGAAIVASIMLPDIAAEKIASKMGSIEKKLDAKIKFASFERKGMFGGQIKDLHISDKKTGEMFFTAELVGGAISPWRLLGGKIAPTDVWINNIEVVVTENEEGGFDLIDRLKNARGKKTKKTTDEPIKKDGSSLISLAFLPELKATDISVRFVNKEGSLWPIKTLKIPAATIVENDNFEIHTTVNIDATKSDIWQLPAELKVDVFVSDDLKPVGGTIVGDTPVRISGIQPLPFLAAGFESISFNKDSQVQVNSLTIDMGKPDGPAFFSAKTVALSPTNWNPTKGIGLEEIVVDGPMFYDHIRKDGRSKLYDIQNMFRPKAPRNVIQKSFDIVRAHSFKRDRKRSFRGLAPLVPKKTVANAPEKKPVPNADIGTRWERVMRLLPKQFLIKNASATVKDDREVKDIEGWAKLLEAKHGNLEFVHDKEAKEIRFDLGFDAFADREKRGKVSSLINWSYNAKKVNSDIKIENLNLLWASQFLGKDVARVIRGGSVSADLTVKPEKGTQIRIHGDVQVSKVNVFHASIAEKAIEDFDASYKFSATYDPNGKISKPKLLDTPTLLDNIPESSALRKGSVIVESGEATLNGVPFIFRPKVFGTGAFPRLPARLDLFVELKKTPVQKLFEAVPAALLGPLKGAKFSGDFSWKLNVETPLKHAADMKWDSQTRTDNIRVNYLPQRVDVRRLLNDTKLLIKDTIRQGGKEHKFRRKMYIPTMRSPGDGFISENMAISGDTLAAHRAAHPVRGPSGNINSSAAGTDPHGYHRLTGLSPFLIRAILTTEDKGFWRHSGISFWALRESLQANLNSGTIRRGGSTIAMQFVKNMFLDRKKIYARKLREVFLVYVMFHVVNVPRERILEIYFNIIEFGPRIYGIHQASVHYFGKRAIDLSLGEVAFLVSIIPGPKKWHFHWERGEIPDWWFRRMKRYIEIMYKAGRVTEEERNEAIEKPPLFWKPEPGGPRYRPKEPIVPIDESETARKLNEILNPDAPKTPKAPVVPTPSPKPSEGKVFDPEL